MGNWYYSCDGVKDNGDLQVYDTYMLDYTYIFIDPCPYTGYITKVHVAGGTSFSFGVFQLVESVDSQRKFRLLRRPYPNFNEFGSYGQANQTDPFTFSSGWSHDYYGLISGPVYGLLQEYNNTSGTYDPPPQNTPGNPPTKAILAPFLKSWSGVNYIPIEINAGEYFGFKINGGICLNIHDFEHTEELDGGYHYFDGDAVDDDIGQERWFTREHRVQGDHTGNDHIWYSGEPQIRVFVDAIEPSSSSSLSSSSSSTSVSSTSLDSSSSLSSSSSSVSSSSVSSTSVSSSSLSWSSFSSTQGFLHDGFNFTTSGDADWFKQGSVVQSGIEALQGGNIADSQETRIDLNTDALADGTLYWYWKVSSESNFDYLRFYINGIQQTSISGIVDWVQKSYHILGTDDVYWLYDKDSSGSSGSDTGWLDTFTFVADSSSSKSSSSESASSSSVSSSFSLSSKSSFAGFWYGIDGTPTVGIEGGTNNTRVQRDEVNWGNAPVQVDGFVTKIQLYVSSPGIFKFATFEGFPQSTSYNFTDIEWIEDINFENGLHTYDFIVNGVVPLQVFDNATWLGFYSNPGNIFYTDLGGEIGTWVDGGDQIGDGVGTFFSNVSTGGYQIRFFIEQSYSASSSSSSLSSSSLSSSSSSSSLSSSSVSSSSLSSSSLSSSSLSSSSSSSSLSSSSSSTSSSSSSSYSIKEGFWYGKDGIDNTQVPDGDVLSVVNSNDTTIPFVGQAGQPTFDQPNPSAGYIDIIQYYIYDGSPATFKWSTFTRSGFGSFRDKNFITTAPIVGSTPIGLITLFAGKDFNSSELPFNVGEYFGFFSSTGRIMRHTTGGPGYFYDDLDQIGNNAFSAYSYNSADIVQLRVHVAFSISSSSSSSFSFSSSSFSFSSSSSSSLAIHSSSSSSVSISSSSSSFSNEFEHNGLYFNTSGDADWFLQGSTVNTGPQAFQSGDINHNETTRIDLVNPAVWKRELTFYWKVSSEPNFDELRFYINGLQEEISGEVDWVQKTYNIYVGDVVYWEYDKDNSQSEGDDTAWLDTFTLSGELSSSSVSSSSSSYSSSSYSVSSSSDSSSSESAIFTKIWGFNTLYQNPPNYYDNEYFQVTNIDEEEPGDPDPGFSILKVGTANSTYDHGAKRSLLQAKLERLYEITNDGDDISFATLWIYGQLNAASPIQPIDLLLYKILKTWNPTYASWISNSLEKTGFNEDFPVGSPYSVQKGLTHKQRWDTVDELGYPWDSGGMRRFWSTRGLGNKIDRDGVVSDFYDDIIDPSPRWWSFDVTQDIKDFVDGIIVNNGWVLIQRPEDAINASNPSFSHGIFDKFHTDESPYLEIGLPNYSSSSAFSESSSSYSSSSLSSKSYLFSSSSSSRSASISSLSSSSSSASTAAAERVRRISAWSINRKVQKNYGVPTPVGDPDQMDIWYQPASSQFTRAVVLFLQYSTYSSYYSRNSSGVWYYDDPETETGPHPYLYDFHGYYSPLNPCGYVPLHPVGIPGDYPNLTDGLLSWGNPGLYPDWFQGNFINAPGNTNPAERIHWWTGVAIWYEDKIQEIENQSGDNFRINLEGDYGTDYPLTGGETDRDNYGPNGYIKMNIATFAGVFQPYKTDTDNLAVKETHYPVSILGISKVGQTVKFNQNNDQTWPLHYDGDDYNPVDGTSPQSGDPGFINPDADFVGTRRISGVGITTHIGTVPSNRHFQDSPVLVPEVESEITKVTDNDASESGLEGWDWQQVIYERNDPINTGNTAGRKMNETPYTTYPFLSSVEAPEDNLFEIDRAFGITLLLDGSPVPLSSSASSTSFSSSISSSSSSGSFSSSSSFFSSSSSSYSRACPDPGAECKVWPLTINDVDNELMVVNFPPNVCVNSGAAFLRRADYIFEQSAPSTVWNIQHDMNTFFLLIQVYDDCRNHIFPKEIYIIDNNNVQIEFDDPMSGTAHFIYLERTSIYISQDEEDIMEMGIGPNLGYWKVGNGTSVVGTAPQEWSPTIQNDLESPTASGSYWRIYENDDNYFLDFIVPWGEALTIREIGIFNVNDDLMFYSKCSDLHKPESARVVLHYEILKREVTLSSSSSSSSFSFSSSSFSSSSSVSSSSSRSSSSSSSLSSSVSLSVSSSSSSLSSSSSSSQSISSFVSSSSSSVSSSSSSVSSSSLSSSSSSSSLSSSSSSLSSSSSSESSSSSSLSSSSESSVSLSSSSVSSSSSSVSSSSSSSSNSSSSSLSSSSSSSSNSSSSSSSSSQSISSFISSSSLSSSSLSSSSSSLSSLSSSSSMSSSSSSLPVISSSSSVSSSSLSSSSSMSSSSTQPTGSSTSSSSFSSSSSVSSSSSSLSSSSSSLSSSSSSSSSLSSSSSSSSLSLSSSSSSSSLSSSSSSSSLSSSSSSSSLSSSSSSSSLSSSSSSSSLSSSSSVSSSSFKSSSSSSYFSSSSVSSSSLSFSSSSSSLIPWTLTTGFTLSAGTLSGGSFEDTWVGFDGFEHCFNEAATVDALELIYEFQNVPSIGPDDILHAHIIYSYDGDPAHIIKLQLWNYDLSQWDYVTDDLRDFGYTAGSLNPLTFNWGFGQVLDPITDYLDSGNMLMKIVHISHGIIFHGFCVDLIELDQGFQSSSSSSSSSASLSISSSSSSSGISAESSSSFSEP